MILQSPAPPANAELELKRLSKAVMNLVFNEPFYAFLVMRLERVPSTQYPALASDGQTLWFNPNYTRDCSDAELVGALAHITMHVAHGHPWRGAGRDQECWNESCDLAINPVLEQSHFQIPDDHRIQDRFRGKSAEAVYLVVLEEKIQQDSSSGQAPNGGGGNGGNGSGNGSSGSGSSSNPSSNPGCGQVVVPNLNAAAMSKLEADWTLAVDQAYQYSAGRGVLPNGAEELVKNLKKPIVNWKAELRRYMQQLAKNDYSWVRPNPRYMSLGLYLPDLRGVETGEIVIALDTSGSTYNCVEMFVAEISDILLEVKPKRVHVLHIDAALHHVDIFETGDEISSEYKLHGGGGTRFEPAFEYVATLENPPACLVYLTDNWGSYPDETPEYPVLWATTDETRAKAAPFGEIIPGLSASGL